MNVDGESKRRKEELSNVGSEEATCADTKAISLSWIKHWCLEGIQDARTGTDWRVPLITGCCAMPDGLVVICDFANSKIKLLDERLNFKVDVICNHSPYDVAPIDDNSVIVSIPKENLIQIFNVKPGLKGDREIKLKYGGNDLECYGVMVQNKNIFVGIKRPLAGVLITSMDGNVVKFIAHRGPGYPRYVYVNSTGTLIYYSSPGSSYSGYGRRSTGAFVYCMTEDEHGLFRYSDDSLIKPGSILGDDLGNLLVCDNNSFTVRQIKPTGILGTYYALQCTYLPTSNSRITCTSFCFNRKTDQLITASKRDVDFIKRYFGIEGNAFLYLFNRDNRKWWIRCLDYVPYVPLIIGVGIPCWIILQSIVRQLIRK